MKEFTDIEAVGPPEKIPFNRTLYSSLYDTPDIESLINLRF